MEIEFAKNETKSAKALKRSLHTLLQKHTFLSLTVNDLCQEAEVSRSSFYQNFIDKYDLFESYLKDLYEYTLNLRALNSEEEFISGFLTFLFENRKFIKNSFDFQDAELAYIHVNLIESTLTRLSLLKNESLNPHSDDFKIKIRFLAGGLLGLVTTIVNSKDEISKEAFVSFALEASQAIDSIE